MGTDPTPCDAADLQSPQRAQDHCIFVRHERLYAVSVSAARAVLIAAPATPAPHSALVLVGAVNWRGEVLPLVQLDILLGMRSRAYSNEDQILVLSCNGTDLGLVVDRVREIRPIDPARITAAPDHVPGHHLFTGCWQSPDGAVTILDADGLVASAVTTVSKGYYDRRVARSAAAIAGHS